MESFFQDGQTDKLAPQRAIEKRTYPPRSTIHRNSKEKKKKRKKYTIQFPLIRLLLVLFFLLIFVTLTSPFWL